MTPEEKAGALSAAAAAKGAAGSPGEAPREAEGAGLAQVSAEDILSPGESVHVMVPAHLRASGAARERRREPPSPTDVARQLFLPLGEPEQA